MSEPKLNLKEETSAKKTRSPPKKAKVEQTVPKKKKLKTFIIRYSFFVYDTSSITSFPETRQPVS